MQEKFQITHALLSEDQSKGINVTLNILITLFESSSSKIGLFNFLTAKVPAKVPAKVYSKVLIPL